MPKINASLKRTFDKVDSLLEVEPTPVGRSGRLILKDAEGKHITLARSDAKLTPAGKRFFEKTGKQYNSAFDHELPLVRRGAREFPIPLREVEVVLVERLRAAQARSEGRTGGTIHRVVRQEPAEHQCGAFTASCPRSRRAKQTRAPVPSACGPVSS